MDAALSADLSERYDVVVVGGGAAGLSGALALARAGRSVLVIDAGEPRNAPATGVHNYLGREGISPRELLAAGRAEVTGYGGQIVDATVSTARRMDGPLADPTGGFSVDLVDGRAVRTRRLLVTTGLVDQLPQLPGLAERWGRDVLHCPYCHGREVRDQAIGVLATSPMSVHQTLMWRQWSADITLFLHTADEPTDEQWEQLAARSVSVVDGEVAGLEVRDDRLTGVRLTSGQTIPRAALVVAPRVVARSGLLADLGLSPIDHRIGEHVGGTRIDADVVGATAVTGVWVAGNVTDPFAHAISAAAMGLAAAAAINADLIAEETNAAVAARAAD